MSPPTPTPTIGEPIKLSGIAPVARWFEAEDGGFLELSEEVVNLDLSLNLHLFRNPNCLEAHWVIGCALILKDAPVGRA